MEYILGVDGGGTKTVALLGDRNGKVLARGVSGPSNASALGFEAACSALESAISTVRIDFPGHVSALCLGLAGAGRKEEMERFQNWAAHRFPTSAVMVVSDAEILLATGAGAGPALALVCGTGSIVFGRTVTGELVRAGGWGYLFGDEGSGYAMGVAALRAIMQAYDGRGRETLLSKLVLESYGLQSPPELVSKIYGAKFHPSVASSLTAFVEQAATLGDLVAIDILKESSTDLARTVAAVYSRLGTSPVPLVIAGGAILHGSFLQKEFKHACEHQGLSFSEVHYVVEPAESALKLAMQILLG